MANLIGVSNMLLGVDLGTSTLKIALYDYESKNIVILIKENIDTLSPRPDIAEQNPNEWWQKFIIGIRRIRAMGYDLEEIEGIGVVSQREGIVLMDRYGKNLTNCITWMDRRSEKQVETIKNTIDEKEIYYRTGLRVSAGFTATKLLWFKENMPQVLERASSYLQPKDYIVFRLTDTYITDFSLASRTLLFDIHKLKWINEFFEELELQNKFPKVYWSNEVVGETTSTVQRTAGIPKGIPVVAGGGDRQGENLGCCKARSDSVAISLGTAINLNVSLTKPYIDSEMRSTTSIHLLKNRWLLELGLSSGTLLIKWFVDNFAKDLGDEAYNILTQKAYEIPDGSEGLYVFPFLIGARAPWWRSGIRAGIINLSQGHNRFHIFRAILESLSYNVKAAYETIRNASNNIKNIYVMGGGAENDLWLKILSNTLNHQIKALQIENAGVLAAASLYLIKNPNYLQKVLPETVVKKIYIPDKYKAHKYNLLYNQYIQKIEKYFIYHS